MESKVIAFLAFLCVMQNIESKSVKPFWGANPFMVGAGGGLVPTLDAELRPIVAEIQMRLSQASAISKSTIGMNVGLASKGVGMATSVAKNNVKTLMNGLQSNPNTTKECMDLNKLTIDQLNSASKNQLSFCSKSSQVQLKAMNQVQKELNLQVATLNSELNLAVSQCKLENPLPTDTTAVTECVSTKAEDIKTKITGLEQNILATVSAVDTGITQIVDGARSCTDHVQTQLQEQAGSIAEQLDQCSVAFAAPVAAAAAAANDSDDDDDDDDA